MSSFRYSFLKLFTLLGLLVQIFLAPVGTAQSNPNFDVRLQLDFAAVEQTLKLYEDQPISTAVLAGLRGNAIVAATTGMIADRQGVSSRLTDYLDSLKYHQTLEDDIYHLESGRADAAGIRILLDEMKNRNFSRRVVATVEQIFPADAAISLVIPVYVVALGHENVDAFVRRITWHGDTPEFVGENEGELTIVINLAHAVNYDPTPVESFVSLLGVVAHEVFHAAFSAYKATSPDWQEYTATNRTYAHNLLDLTQNEGIAYYLSLDQRGRGYLPRDWDTHTREVVNSFNRNVDELLSGKVTPRRAQELLRTANLSGYWESYGAMTGMFLAREIDLRLGRAALIETIARGPIDFFSKYQSLSTQNSTLPILSKRLVSSLLR